jgi:hypothetical protein
MNAPPARGLGILGVFVFVACAADEPNVSETQSASTPVEGQGTTYQGTTYQGTTYQGTTYQGTTYQGTTYQGASFGGASLSDGAVVGTTLSAWTRQPNGVWEQRFPAKICYWNKTRTVMTSCTNVNPNHFPSPLAGSIWPATFLQTHADGTTSPVAGLLQIGVSSTTHTAVRPDPSAAMFAMTGSDPEAAGCPLVPFGPNCSNPAGCRKNCDVWLYDVRLADVLDANGVPVSFCPNGEHAIAYAQTWDATGQLVANQSTQFTFVCTNGTIAKCTRWGYRPFGSANNSSGVSTQLGGYHQACIRAATADYCANGHSFTKDGTLVDVYDYTPGGYGNAVGLIPHTRGGLVPFADATALMFETSFDKYGAKIVDHLRYQELSGQTGYGSLTDPAVGCPGRFALKDPNDWSTGWVRGAPTFVDPTVSIDSTPACAHSELQRGKWMHDLCSPCTQHVAAVAPHCSDPSDVRGWDAECVSQALNSSVCSTADRMAVHSECLGGMALSKLDTGCTLRVCLDPSFAGCCGSLLTGWSQSCVAAANAKCLGGIETSVKGFCGTPL